MGKQQAGRKCRLAILAPEAEDRPASADRVIVDLLNFALLPVVELKLLPDVLAFRDEANLLDEGNYISGADPFTSTAGHFLRLATGPDFPPLE